MKEKILIVGSGGRENAFATKFAEDSVVYAVLDFENPGIIEEVNKTGGKYIIANSADPEIVKRFALEHKPDYAFVSADAPLANGVVDILLDADIKTVGATKDAARIEWDKIYSIDLVKNICPEYTPYYKIINTEKELSRAVDSFKSKGLEVVVKPQGLTGGKGVKVMPEHLHNYDEVINYASELLQKNPEEQVLLVEKLYGIEFTIMGITDGESLVLAPASYDYPFRDEDDKGMGTGGMGCFTNSDKKLPFMNDTDLEDCRRIMQLSIDKMKANQVPFNGVLNGGFFKTATGIKFMEFNGRFGDPEGLNILSVLESSFLELIKDIWYKRLSEKSLRFSGEASVVKYLVAKEYPMASPKALTFRLNKKAIKDMGIHIFYSSCIKDGDDYQTLKKSRVVALGVTDRDISKASERINLAIERHVEGALEYRKDIGSKENLKKLENNSNSL